MQVQENKMSQYHGRAGAARAGGSDERWARTRVSEVKGSSTLGCLAAAADGGIGDSGGHSEWGNADKRCDVSRVNALSRVTKVSRSRKKVSQ